MAAGTYIGLTRDEVEELAASALPSAEQETFHYFAKLVCAWFHHAQHEHTEALKRDLSHLLENSATPEIASRFASRLAGAALAANFQSIPEAMLTEALAEESTFRIRLAVDFTQFEEVVFYGRGSEQREADIPKCFGLSSQRVSFTNFETVLVFIRFTHDPELDPALRGQTILKLFANVPQADLEMLFPNSEIRMRLMDKLFIGVPAFVSGLIVLFTKLGSALLLAGGVLAFWLGFSDREVRIDQAALVGLLTAAGALGGYLWKQFNNFKNRKIRFMKALTERLYFKNLDNNAGVLTALGDYAEESECKETLLAAAILLRDGALTEDEMQNRIEVLTEPHCERFDIADAVDKLLQLGIARQHEERWVIRPLQECIRIIDERWDNLFRA